jgi:hypothetical protein
MRRDRWRVLALAAIPATLLAFARGDALYAGAACIGIVGTVMAIVRPQALRPLFGERARRYGMVSSLALVVTSLVPIEVRSDYLRVATILATDPAIPRTATIYVVKETFPAGSELTIEPDFGEVIKVGLDEASHFAVIDLHPGARFAHPVRYAIVSASGAVRSIDNEWLPTVNGLRWTTDGETTVNGRTVVALTNKDWPFPQVELSIHAPATPAADAAGRKVALVIDGGHRQRDWTDRFAQKLDEDTLAVAEALVERGHDVRRFGGYRGSVAPGARLSDVRREIDRIAREVGPGDEVVLYLNGHGGDGGFALFDRSGSREWMSYADLGSWLSSIPSTIPVQVIVDSCRSGSAVGPLSRRDNTVVSTATDERYSAPGGLGSRPTFSAVVARAAKEQASDLDRDGSVSLSEALAVATRAHLDIGSRNIATRGASGRLAGATQPASATPAGSPTAVPPAASPPPAGPATTGPARTSAPTLAPIVLPPTPAPLRFRAAAPPQWVVGQLQEHSFCSPTPATATSACGPFPRTTDPSGGSPPYHFQLGSGAGFPPIGVSLGKDGLLTGTPRSPGTYTFEVCAVDLSADQVCQRVTLVVTAAAAAPSPTARPATATPTPTPIRVATVGTVATKTCTVQSGSGSLTYYRVTLSGSVTGSLNARVAFVNSTMTCPGWTGFGPDCRRTSDAQPETVQWTATRTGVLGGVDHPDVWFEGSVAPFRTTVNVRCP